MKTDHLINILGDLNKLKTLDEQELILLADKYPYCHNFQFLVAKKKQISNNTDNLDAFQKLSHYISDKGHLYNRFSQSECEILNSDYQSEEIDQLIKSELFPQAESTDSEPIQEENLAFDAPPIEIEEPSLEQEEIAVSKENIESQEPASDSPTKNKEEALKDISDSSSIDEDINKKKSPKIPEYEQDQAIAYIDAKPYKIKKKKVKKKKKKATPKSKVKAKTKAKAKAKAIKKSKSKLLGKRSASPKKKKKHKNKKIVVTEKTVINTNEDLSSFTAWLNSLKKSASKEETKKKPTDVLDKKKASKKEEPKKAKKSKKSKKPKNKKEKKGKKKKNKLQHKIDSSLERKSVVVSETLAEMMANQGHIKQAIDIYNQLILQYPEKSSYFASQIKKLD